MNGRFFLALALILVLVLAVGGAAVYAYNMGLAQGMADTARPSVNAPLPFYGPHFFRPFGFGFFGFLGPLFVILIVFALLRGLFWGGRWGRLHGSFDHDIPPAFQEWHRRMHESK